MFFGGEFLFSNVLPGNVPLVRKQIEIFYPVFPWFLPVLCGDSVVSVCLCVITVWVTHRYSVLVVSPLAT